MRGAMKLFGAPNLVTVNKRATFPLHLSSGSIWATERDRVSPRKNRFSGQCMLDVINHQPRALRI